MLNRYSIFPVGALLILAAVLLPTGVNALTFTPDRINSSVYPGVPQIEELTLFNESSETMSYVLSPVSLEIIDASNGIAKFLLDSAGDQDIQWLTVQPTQFVLESGEQITVDVQITAPASSSGSLMGGIATTFTAVRSGKPGDIITKGVTGPFVFAEVNSVDSNKSGYIESFNTTDGSRLTSQLPVSLMVSFANDGTVHLQPQGKIEVYDLFGKVVSTMQVNDAGQTILPKTSRNFNITWDSATEERTSGIKINREKLLIGPMRLHITMTYDDKPIESEIIVWIMPWWVISLMAVLIVGIFTLRVRLRRV